MPRKILITEEIVEIGMQYLDEQGYEVKMASGSEKNILIDEVRDCDAILVRTAKIGREILEAGENLKVVAKHGVGLDNIDVEAATSLGIVVTNCPFSNKNSVAEHTIGLLLDLAKNTLIVDKGLRNGFYGIRDKVNGVELDGKVLGLIGLGSIGSLVAKKAYRGFDMKVVAYDPFVKQEDVINEVELIDNWDSVFESADFISLHLPSTESTKGIIGAREFSLMKESAFFINAARGEVVDEKALVEALKKGLIAGAGLDVFDKEPPKKDNPIFEIGNVVVTPHCAALTKEARERMALHAAMGIDEVLSGKIVSWAVNNI